MRRVVNSVRGMRAQEALEVLRLLPQRSAVPVAKTIKSALANAEENFGYSRDELYVAEVYADKGPTRRWRRFGARGRFKPIDHRSSHLTVVLRERQTEMSS